MQTGFTVCLHFFKVVLLKMIYSKSGLIVISVFYNHIQQ